MQNDKVDDNCNIYQEKGVQIQEKSTLTEKLSDENEIYMRGWNGLWYKSVRKKKRKQTDYDIQVWEEEKKNWEKSNALTVKLSDENEMNTRATKGLITSVKKKEEEKTKRNETHSQEHYQRWTKSTWEQQTGIMLVFHGKLEQKTDDLE